MALTNSQYDIIIRGFEEKQRRNRRLLEERTAYVHSHVEGYRELSDSIASASTAQGRKLLAGDEHALDEHDQRAFRHEEAAPFGCGAFRGLSGSCL